MEYFKKVAAVILTIFSVTTATPEFHSFETRYEGEHIANEEVEVDREEQYAIISVTALSEKLLSTVNYHDFATGYTAIRDDTSERCYVLKTGHTLEEMMGNFENSVKRNGFFPITQEFTCESKTIIPNEELSERYGQRIATFCGDHEVVFSQQKYLERTKRSVKMLSGNSILCGVCVSLNCG